jgi:hypothetical protein
LIVESKPEGSFVGKLSFQNAVTATLKEVEEVEELRS